MGRVNLTLCNMFFSMLYFGVVLCSTTVLWSREGVTLKEMRALNQHLRSRWSWRSWKHRSASRECMNWQKPRWFSRLNMQVTDLQVIPVGECKKTWAPWVWLMSWWAQRRKPSEKYSSFACMYTYIYIWWGNVRHIWGKALKSQTTSRNHI